jgi:hypothetical protein
MIAAALLPARAANILSSKELGQDPKVYCSEMAARALTASGVQLTSGALETNLTPKRFQELIEKQTGDWTWSHFSQKASREQRGAAASRRGERRGSIIIE